MNRGLLIALPIHRIARPSHGSSARRPLKRLPLAGWQRWRIGCERGRPGTADRTSRPDDASPAEPRGRRGLDAASSQPSDPEGMAGRLDRAHERKENPASSGRLANAVHPLWLRSWPRAGPKWHRAGRLHGRDPEGRGLASAAPRAGAPRATDRRPTACGAIAGAQAASRGGGSHASLLPAGMPRTAREPPSATCLRRTWWRPRRIRRTWRHPR